MVLGSLVIQGLTLRPLIAALHLKEDNPVIAEVARARAAAFQAALDEIDGDPSEEAEILRLEYRAVLLRAAATTAAFPPASCRPTRCAGARSAPRGTRSSRCAESGTIGDDAFHQLEEEFDRAELSAQA